MDLRPAWQAGLTSLPSLLIALQPVAACQPPIAIAPASASGIGAAMVAGESWDPSYQRPTELEDDSIAEVLTVL